MTEPSCIAPHGRRDSQMAWVARNGATLSVIGRAQPYRQLTLSPDQKRAAVEMMGDGRTVGHLAAGACAWYDHASDH